MKKLWNIITTIAMVIVVIFACIFFLPKLFGITPMAVLSGSMEPTFHVGSLVFVKSVNPDEVKVGDAVTYQLAGADKVVTHRIINVNAEDKTIETKGDANDTADGSAVPFANIVGKAFAFSIPLLGYLAVYLSSTQGMIILGTIIVVILFLSFLPDLLGDSDKKKKKKGDEAK